MPPKGSPLESLFMLVVLERREAELLATRALVQAVLPEGKSGEPAIKAFDEYTERMFPFLESAKALVKEDEKKALEDFARHKVRLNLASVFAAQRASTKARKKAVEAMRLKAKPK